jgi:SAM-dependent methyltransferase
MPVSQSDPKRPEAEFDVYADRYEDLLGDPLRDRFASSHQYFHRRKLEVLRDYLAASGRPSRSLQWLDFGCGTGELLRLGASHFALACGCDVSAESVKHCSDLQVKVQERPESIPYDPETFDVVTAACVYHHVPLAERRPLTQAILRILRPGGLFCVFEHNPWNPVTQLIVKRSPVDVNAILLRPREALGLLRKSGFERLSLTYYLFAPEFVAQKLPELETLLHRVPLGGQYALFGEKPGPRARTPLT